jgi:hypothetical protein
MAIKMFHRDNPDRLLPMISKDARLVVWKGVGHGKHELRRIGEW